MQNEKLFQVPITFCEKEDLMNLYITMNMKNKFVFTGFFCFRFLKIDSNSVHNNMWQHAKK